MTEQPNPTGVQVEILIVEDSPVEAEMLRRILVRAGYRVPPIAKNGEEGLQALREHPCTLVMSDINMPVMNGYQLCHAIKFDEKLWGTPVILVTMLSEPKDIIKALDVGADGYITKPYVEDVLLGRIRSLLANPATRKLAEERRRILLEYGGEKYSVAVGSPQMANLMLSVYENSLILNQELMDIQNQLTVLNEGLDQKVRERTAALQESETKFRTVFDEAKDGIVLIDAESGLVADCNAEFERQCGRPLAQLKTLHIWELRPPEQQEAARRKFEEVKTTGHGSTELGFQRPDGSFMPADVVATRVRIGDCNYAMSISRDVTERKQVEAAFRTLVGTAAANIGADFFRATVHSLCAWIDVECALISEVVDGKQAQALAMQLDGQWVEHFAYTLPGTPCENAAQNGYCEYHEGVAQLFSADKDLAELRAEAYIGTPIRDKNGAVIGILCALSRHKFVPPQQVREVFEIIAARAGVEIERMRMEKELRLHSEIEQNMAEAVYLIRVSDGVIVHTNPFFDRMFGYGPGELIGKHVSIVNAPGDQSAEAVANEIISSLNQTGVWNGEVHNIRKDGSTFWCHANVFTFEHPQHGKVWLSMHQDITEQKRVEAQLKENEARYRQIIQTSMDGFWISDTKGRILDVNDAYCRMSGYTREELLSMRVADVEAKESPEEVAQHTQKIMAQGYARFETRHRRKDGQLLDIEVSSVHRPGPEDGSFLVFLRDITARKQAEAQLAEQLDELKRWYEVMTGREMRVMELKREVNELLKQSGQPPRYLSVEQADAEGLNTE